MPTVALITDDPIRDGGSPGPTFTRFVLPFAYAPQPYRGPKPDAVYVPTPPQHDDVRRRYLTPETADTLFDRALWLELDAPAITSEHLFTDLDAAAHGDVGARLALRHAPPRLVLFEWAAHARQFALSDGEGEPGQHPDLLHTGFLILDVEFTGAGSTPPTLTHLLHLNELFRWWQRPYAGYSEKGYRHFFGLPRGEDPHAAYFARWASHLTHPFHASRDGHLWRLFPDAWHAEARSCVETGGRPDEDGRHVSGWIAYPDPRAFVWTCAGVAGGATALPGAPLSLEALPAEWIRLLNVAAPALRATSAFEQRWASERTYERWIHAGTLYGFCAHAGALLARAGDKLPLHRHFAELYFDQTLLLLYLRVSTFRFSRELSDMSSAARDSGGRWRRRLAEEFQELRGAFALFTNLYRFPMLSHQQQGIELYALARRCLDIEELFREIQSEVQATDEFLNGATQLDHATMATLLTVVATIALGIALGLDFLQVPGRTSDVFDSGRLKAVAAAGALFLALLILVLVFAEGLARRFREIAKSLRRTRERVRRPSSRGRDDR